MTILKYIKGSNCELTARAAREMSTAWISCESLVNSPVPPLHLRCCDEDYCANIIQTCQREPLVKCQRFC